MTRVPVLGVGVDSIERAELVPRVLDMVDVERRSTVTYLNVHVSNLAQRDEALRRFLNASDLCYCDGNGIVHGARILGHRLPERMTGADWIWDLAAAAEARLRLYWIGGEEGATEEAARKLVARYPRLDIRTDHGFHPRSGRENDACIERINRASPHIVLVGMGSPTQEQWVAERRERIEAPVVWCLGATADFVSGRVPRVGPDWLVTHHEWASRLLADPGRLWKRYLVGNAMFLARIGRARLRQSRSEAGL